MNCRNCFYFSKNKHGTYCALNGERAQSVGYCNAHFPKTGSQWCATCGSRVTHNPDNCPSLPSEPLPALDGEQSRKPNPTRTMAKKKGGKKKGGKRC